MSFTLLLSLYPVVFLRPNYPLFHKRKQQLAADFTRANRRRFVNLYWQGLKRNIAGIYIFFSISLFVKTFYLPKKI